MRYLIIVLSLFLITCEDKGNDTYPVVIKNRVYCYTQEDGINVGRPVQIKLTAHDDRLNFTEIWIQGNQDTVVDVPNDITFSEFRFQLSATVIDCSGDASFNVSSYGNDNIIVYSS